MTVASKIPFFMRIYTNFNKLRLSRAKLSPDRGLYKNWESFWCCHVKFGLKWDRLKKHWFEIHLSEAATNPWIRFEPDFDQETAVFNVSAIH